MHAGEADTATIGDPLRVVIADDDPLVRTLVSAMIDGDESIELVAEATDAREAVSAVAEARPDVALLDWRMPRGGGPWAAREIAARCPATAIVGLTASAGEEAAAAMTQAGAARCLLKGGSQEELVRTLREAVEHHGARAERRDTAGS